MIIVDSHDNIKEIYHILSDQNKFTKVNLKDHILLNFVVNQENVLVRFSKNMLILRVWKIKNRKLLKPAYSRLGVMYGLCKIHKVNIDNSLPFRPILLALNTSYKLAKFLVLILKPLATNEFVVKDVFHFAEKIIDQQPYFFMASLDVESLFTNIPSEETIEICTNELFKKPETVEN